MKLWILLTYLCLISPFYAQVSTAAPTCSRFLKKSANPIQTILDKPLNLTKRQLEILDEHPIFDIFKTSHGVRRIQLEPYLDSKDYRQDADFSGEHLQMGFLRSLLIHIGYDGKFIELHPENFNVRHVLSFQVKDSAEYNPYGTSAPPLSAARRSRIVEMSDLKMANGRLDERSQSLLRKKLGIPEKAKVGHLYFNIPNVRNNESPTEQNPNFNLSAKKLKEEDIDITIVSSISRFRERLPQEVLDFLGEAQNSYDQIVFLSDLQKANIKFSGDKVLVLNDTVNQMPNLHKASDVVLVVGPVNFFEALYSGTPTTVLISENNLGEYNRTTANKLIANGEDFPNFRLIKSLKEDMLSSSQQNTAKYDYEAFRDFLDILYKKILNQLKTRRE